MAIQWEQSTIFNNCFSAYNLVVISIITVAIYTENVNAQQQESDLNPSQISFSARDLMLNDSDKELVNESPDNYDYTSGETDLIGQNLSNSSNYSFSPSRGPYIGLSLGASFADSDNLIQTGTNADLGNTPLGDGYEIDSTHYVIGAQAGYAFENGLRLEIEARYRQQNVDDTSQLANPTGQLAGNTYQLVDSNVQSTSVMANIYYDFVQFHRISKRITPYIKAGLGIAVNRTNIQLDIQPFFSTPGLDTRSIGSECSNIFCPPDQTQVQFAWNIGAGIGFQLTDQLVADLGYQYIDLGSAETEVDPLGDQPKFPGLSAHEVTFGLRYTF